MAGQHNARAFRNIAIMPVLGAHCGLREQWTSERAVRAKSHQTSEHCLQDCQASNRQPGPRRDPARRRRLRRLVLEAPADSTLHGVGEDGVSIRDIAELIGRELGLPVESFSPDEAAAHFGFLGSFIGFDGPASGAATQRLLGWPPSRSASSRTWRRATSDRLVRRHPFASSARERAGRSDESSLRTGRRDRGLL